MQIEMVKVGELRTNCYIVKDASEAIVIDPGFEIEKILPHFTGIKLKAILLTHGHYDHVTEAFKLDSCFRRNDTGDRNDARIPVMIHKDDESMMMFTTQQKADKLLEDGSTFNIGHLTFVILHTPGHTPGGMCIYNSKENVLFTGDTLFYHDHGRTDLPGSDQAQMDESLKKLFKLPPQTRVLPGHGRESTIGDEKDLFF